MTPYEQLKEAQEAGKLRLLLWHEEGELLINPVWDRDLAPDESDTLFQLFLDSIDEIEAQHSIKKKKVEGSLFSAIQNYRSNHAKGKAQQRVQNIRPSGLRQDNVSHERGLPGW